MPHPPPVAVGPKTDEGLDYIIGLEDRQAAGEPLDEAERAALTRAHQQIAPIAEAVAMSVARLAPIGEAIAAGVAESRRRHARRAPRTISRRPRARGRRSPSARRASSSSTTSGTDPGADLIHTEHP